MIYDTHAHYDDEAFEPDRDDLLQSLPKQGIHRVVNIGSDLQTCRQTIQLMDRYDHVYGALGVHPSEVGELTEESFAWIGELLAHPKCVAVGEFGLDYHTKDLDRELQKKWFLRHLELCRTAKLPAVIHSRDAAKDTLDILKDQNIGEIGGVMHCFSYGAQIAAEVVSLGLYIGIGGVVTFSNAKKVQEAVREIPLDRIVLETDCPYLSPDPHRGERNSSLRLPYVIRAIARIKEMDPNEIEEITWNNACALYRQ